MSPAWKQREAGTETHIFPQSSVCLTHSPHLPIHPSNLTTQPSYLTAQQAKVKDFAVVRPVVEEGGYVGVWGLQGRGLAAEPLIGFYTHKPQVSKGRRRGRRRRRRRGRRKRRRRRGRARRRRRKRRRGRARIRKRSRSRRRNGWEPFLDLDLELMGVFTLGKRSGTPGATGGGGGCRYQPKLNQTKLKRAALREWGNAGWRFGGLEGGEGHAGKGWGLAGA